MFVELSLVTAKCDIAEKLFIRISSEIGRHRRNNSSKNGCSEASFLAASARMWEVFMLYLNCLGLPLLDCEQVASYMCERQGGTLSEFQSFAGPGTHTKKGVESK